MDECKPPAISFKNFSLLILPVNRHFGGRLTVTINIYFDKDFCNYTL